jgi:adenylate cyclase
MADQSKQKEFADKVWFWYLVGDDRNLSNSTKRQIALEHALHHLLPGKPRCVLCEIPLGGAGALITGPILGLHPSALTPRLCNACERLILKMEGGAEVNLSLLFADIRGSTSRAQEISSTEYKRFIQRFYKAVSGVLIQRNALVNRLVGDEVVGLFVPRFAGADHSKVAIESALEILQATGHADEGGPWAPIGIGVHTGTAYVGSVGSKEGINEISVVGIAANLTARLSSTAAKGEVLISDEAAQAANLADENLEQRDLQLKGISAPVHVRVMHIGPAGK